MRVRASIAVFDSLVDDYGSVADLLVEYVGRRWFEGTDVSRYSSLANRVLMVNEEALRDEDAALAS